MDPFAVLGLPPAASEDEVRRAFRRLAQRYHPDHAPGDPLAAERFRSLHAAYTAALEQIRQREQAPAMEAEDRGASFNAGGRTYHRGADGRLWWWSASRERWVPIANGVMPAAGHVAGRGAARLLRWWRG